MIEIHHLKNVNLIQTILKLVQMYFVFPFYLLVPTGYLVMSGYLITTIGYWLPLVTSGYFLITFGSLF